MSWLFEWVNSKYWIPKPWHTRENASQQNLVSTISPSEALADPDHARRLEFFGFYPALPVHTHQRQ